jgi:RNA polymerase sigma-70 factor (ECF subfamily)
MMQGADLSSSTSASLIDRVRRLEPEAWQRLCAIYGPLVYRWARVAGLQDADAADVGQEVFRTVAARIESFEQRDGDGSFRGWLRTITRHKLGDWLRKRAGRPATGGDDVHSWNQIPEVLPGNDPTEAGLDADRLLLHRTLQTLCGEFESSTWRAFWMATVEDRPIDLIAEELGLTRGAVRQAKYRVLRRLRVEITER